MGHKNLKIIENTSTIWDRCRKCPCLRSCLNCITYDIVFPEYYHTCLFHYDFIPQFNTQDVNIEGLTFQTVSPIKIIPNKATAKPLHFYEQNSTVVLLNIATLLIESPTACLVPQLISHLHESIQLMTDSLRQRFAATTGGFSLIFKVSFHFSSIILFHYSKIQRSVCTLKKMLS